MTVTARRAPALHTLLTAVDTHARATVADAKREVGPVVISQTPRRSGKTAQALAPRVSRTPTGAALLVQAPRGRMHDQKARIAQVVRWVNRGTGIYRTSAGGGKQRIRSRRPLGRMTLPGGRKVWSVKGQRPNPFIGRIQTVATPRVERVFREGAATLERVVAKEF